MTNDASRSDSFASSPDWDAIARFLADESSAEEAARVRQWLEARPTDKALIEQLSSDTPSPPADVDVEAALARVHARMEQPAGMPRLTLERGSALRSRRSTPVVLLLTAAAAAFVGFLTLRRAPITSPSGAVIAARTYSTRTGQRDSIMLADGSRVILGPDSRLVVSADFGTSTRSVELQGDGFFDVHHDAAKPFTVRIGNAVLEDLGTTFAVESDAGDATSVSVLSGSVRLRLNGSPATAGAILAAGDRGALTVDGHVRAYPNTVRSDDAAWTTGRIVFHDASIARVIGELRRWYGVELHVDSSLLSNHVTTTIENGDSIDEVLKRVALMLGARVDRQGDSATIHLIRGSAPVR